MSTGRVRSLMLRGVFLFGPDEVDYLFSAGGTFGQHPAAWTAYSRFIEDTSGDWASSRSRPAPNAHMTSAKPAY